MKKIIPIVLGFIIVAGGAFYAGMRYDQSKNASARQARGQQFGGGAGARGGVRGAGANGGFVSGDILSKDDTSITVALRDGGSKIVFLSGTTQVMKTGTGSLQDLTIGEQVTVMGSANADGSVNAESVQIRPMEQKPVATASAPKSTLANEKAFTVTGSNFSFAPSTMTVKKGDAVAITFKNSDGFHDFRIDEFNVATQKIGAGTEETVRFTADKTGSFEYYCSVGQHRAMGMKGTLIVQ